MKLFSVVNLTKFVIDENVWQRSLSPSDGHVPPLLELFPNGHPSDTKSLSAYVPYHSLHLLGLLFPLFHGWGTMRRSEIRSPSLLRSSGKSISGNSKFFGHFCFWFPFSTKFKAFFYFRHFVSNLSFCSIVSILFQCTKLK